MVGPTIRCFRRATAHGRAVELAKVMRYKYLCLILIFYGLVLSSCTRTEGFVEIIVRDVQKVEDTIPGWFIKAMGLDYSSGKGVTILMHEHLAKYGTLIDKFKDENDDLHKIWEYSDQIGIIDKFRKSYEGLNPNMWYFGWTSNNIIIEEKLTGDGFAFTLRYPPPGVPWTKLLASGKKGLATDRKNAVVIKTQSNKHARIFLFGQGSFCTEIVIF